MSQAAELAGRIYGDEPLRARLRRAAQEIYTEITLQKPAFFLWFPFLLSIGVGLYYALPVEPPAVLGIFALLFCTAVLVFWWLQPVAKVLMLLVFLPALGFASAQLRTHSVHTPILQKDMKFARVVGSIVAVEDLGEKDGSRLVLRDLEIEDLSPEETPRRARLKIRSDHGLLVGQRVQVLAALNAPSPPVMPGAFDFQRYLYFQGIGAVGFIYKEFEGPQMQAAGGLTGFIERQRQAIAVTVEKHMPYPAAAIATALMNGRMTAISEDDQNAFRDSGLAHILSISGLHVGLFSGVLFFFTRLLLVLVPGLALHRPVKKYAAVVAIFGAVYYMLLAGSPIPTQRSVLMTGIFFFAMIVDRSPISLRMIAFAALAVLLVFPESLLSASFQMSFGAVAALIVFYDWLRPYWSAWQKQAGFLRKVALYFLGVSFTTVIASTATAPFGLFHFQQFALYGLPANFIAVPIMAFVIMPGVLGALILMPFGMEAWPLMLVEKGSDATLQVAQWAAGLPHAVMHVQMWPLPALLSLVVGVFILTLWRGSLRAFGLVPVALSLLFISAHSLPDILIAPKFDLAGFYGPDGALHISTRRKGEFTRENWARAYGFDPEAELPVWPREGHEGALTCGEAGCLIEMKGARVFYTDDASTLAENCAKADVVLSAVPAPGCGAPVVIDLFDVKDSGAHAIWLEPAGPLVANAQATRGARPWSSLNRKF